MATYYLLLKWTHVLAVVLSGTLFFVRGVLALAGRRDLAMAALPRRGSQLVDSVLLGAALLLMLVLGQYPFVHGWLTAKVLLLVVYIGLGLMALHGERSQAARVGWFTAALLVYLAIITIARFHHPLGPLARVFA